LSATLFSRRRKSGPADDSSTRSPATTPSTNGIPSLALAALIGGPTLALAVGLICVAVFDVHPMDRASAIESLVILGFVVGTLVALVLAVAGKIR
jgi:Ca2+/Na+ antiporter